MLRNADVIMLPGNHDSQEWFGSFKDKYSKFFASVIKLRTNDGDILVEHGDRIYRHWDQSFFSGAEKVPNIVLRGNVIADEIGTAVGGDKYIKFGSEMIYDAYKSVLSQLKQIYNVNKVILGHSHFIKFDDPKGLYMYGFKPTGRVNAFVINENGGISMESYTSNAVYFAKEKIKTWFRFNKNE
jgi:predicted phosphodiesterase